MHLVSNDSQLGDITETEPILSHSEDISENEPILSQSTTAEAEEHCNLVTTEQPQCRICLDNGGEDLIAPCYCRGTQKYVHRSCLDNWRSTKVVGFLGMLVYKFYGEELREMFGYEEHPYGFYSMAILAIVMVGLLYGFFIAIICGRRINERHFHVLAKQELTKEYVVESRDENKNTPDLDSSQVRELRMLGLY